MSDVQRLNVALTPELIAVVKEDVETGDYTSSSDVVRDALRAWKLSRSLRETDTAELGKLWLEGLESGPSIEAQPVFDRLKAKYTRAAGLK